MKWQDHITIDLVILVGKPVVKGTRIAVELVVDLLGRGYTVEQVLQQYEHLTADDVQACLAYTAEVLGLKAVTRKELISLRIVLLKIRTKRPMKFQNGHSSF